MSNIRNGGSRSAAELRRMAAAQEPVHGDNSPQRATLSDHVGVLRTARAKLQDCVFYGLSFVQDDRVPVEHVDDTHSLQIRAARQLIHELAISDDSDRRRPLHGGRDHNYRICIAVGEPLCGFLQTGCGADSGGITIADLSDIHRQILRSEENCEPMMTSTNEPCDSYEFVGGREEYVGVCG